MRDELVRQLQRRRTQVVLALLAAIPLLLALVYVVRGEPELAAGASPQLMHLAGESGLAITVYVVYLTAPLLLVAVAALFAGDAIASEASWGTLRYLLAAPIDRHSLLVRKFGAALLLTVSAVLVIVGAALAVGTACFGWHALDTPVGGIIEPGPATTRMLLTVAYVVVTLIPFCAIAVLCSTFIDAPLAAVAASVAVAVVAQILDVVPTLGQLRVVLPTHYAYAWLDLYVDPPDPTAMASGTLQAAIYAVVALGCAWWWFGRRDITS
jgi:ABC-2 type transport system permease protein